MNWERDRRQQAAKDSPFRHYQRATPRQASLALDLLRQLKEYANLRHMRRSEFSRLISSCLTAIGERRADTNFPRKGIVQPRPGSKSARNDVAPATTAILSQRRK